MTKKTPTKDTALLDALRSNLNLLGEIAMRYQVETQPERPTGDLPVISCPDDVRRLLGPEMAPLAQEQLRVLLLDTKNHVVGQRVIYQGNVSHRPSSGPPRSSARRSWRPSPASSSATTTPASDPDAQPRGRGPHPRAGPGGQAPGHRAARPRGHRRGAVRQPQGTGPHVLTLRNDWAAHAVRPHAGVSLPAHPRNAQARRRHPMLATHTIDPEDLHTITAGRLLGHRRRLRPRRGDRRPLVRLDGRLPDGPQGHLGLPPQAAAGRCPHHPGRGRHGAQRGLQAVRRSPRDHRHLDDQDRPPAGLRRLARPGLHQDRRVRLREGQLPAAGADGRGRPCAPPPLPRQAQPAAPARLLGRLALAAGPGQRGDRPPPVRRRLRLPVLPQGRKAPGGPLGAVASGWLTLPREEEASDG